MAWLDIALLQYMNSDPDHSVIDNKMHGGIIFLNAAPIYQNNEILKGWEEVTINISAMLVIIFVGFHETLFYLVFVT